MTALAHAFSLALLHFVWQGAIVVAVLWAALFVLRKGSSNARYALSCGGLGVLAMLPAITTYVLYRRPIHGAATDAAFSGGQVLLASAARAGDWFSILQAWTFPVWCAGVFLFSARLVWGSRQVSVLRRQGDPANGD